MSLASCPVPPASEQDAPSQAKAPGLLLVSTPIGNLGDMSARAVAALRAADLVLCEDTRTTAHLLRHFGISARMAALHDHNEDRALPGILARVREGAMVALVSDAGTPLVSDPGFRLVRAAVAEGLNVSAVPGANAAVMALTLSGLPPHPYLFHGFLPPKQAARLAALRRLRAAEQAGLSATMIFYEAPHRTTETLADMATVFGPRAAALARELTKKFEEVLRGLLPDLAARCAMTPPRGEVTLLIGPADPDDTAPSETDLDTLLMKALRSQSVREAAAGVARLQDCHGDKFMRGRWKCGSAARLTNDARRDGFCPHHICRFRREGLSRQRCGPYAISGCRNRSPSLNGCMAALESMVCACGWRNVLNRVG